MKNCDFKVCACVIFGLFFLSLFGVFCWSKIDSVHTMLGFFITKAMLSHSVQWIKLAMVCRQSVSGLPHSRSLGLGAVVLQNIRQLAGTSVYSQRDNDEDEVTCHWSPTAQFQLYCTQFHHLNPITANKWEISTFAPSIQRKKKWMRGEGWKSRTGQTFLLTS